MASLNVLASRIAVGRKNLSLSSWLHCFLRLAGQMTISFVVAPPIVGPARCPLRWSSEPDFVGEDRAFRKRRSEREERRLNLMGIQVDLRVRERRREFVHVVRTGPFRQLMGKELGVIGRQTHWRAIFSVHQV